MTTHDAVERMANRSYLYATDLLPASNADPRDGRPTGISEWNYDVPMAFKLLLTGGPRKCTSAIWGTPDEIAIAGDYDEGVARLLRELDKVADPRIAELRSEAREFLEDPKNRRRFFLLECGEIYAMDDEPAAQQNDRLWREISGLSGLESAEWPTRVAKSQRGLLSRIFGRAAPPTQPEGIDIDSLGLGNWSDILYYDFSEENDGGPITA